jgi:hypothetical protein
MARGLSYYVAIVSSGRWRSALLVLLIGATATDFFAAERLSVQQWLADYQESDNDGSEPTESPAEDDVVGLCESPQNRIRRQQLVCWQPTVQAPLPERGTAHRYPILADLASRNGIGGPLRC